MGAPECSLWMCRRLRGRLLTDYLERALYRAKRSEELPDVTVEM